MTNEEQKLREFAAKQFPLSKELKKEVLYNLIQQAKQDELLSDLTALISEHYYPKEFVEWTVKEGIGINEDRTLFYYVSIQIEGHPFKETKELTFNTIDELYQYYKENEQ